MTMGPEAFEYLFQQRAYGAPPPAPDSDSESGAIHSPGPDAATPMYPDATLAKRIIDEQCRGGADGDVGSGDGSEADGSSDFSNPGGTPLDIPGATPVRPLPNSVQAVIPGDSRSYDGSPLVWPSEPTEPDPFIAESPLAAESPSLDMLVSDAFAVAPFSAPDEDPIAAAFARFDAESTAFAEADPMTASPSGGIDERIESFGETPPEPYGGLEQTLQNGGLWGADLTPPRPPGVIG